MEDRKNVSMMNWIIYIASLYSTLVSSTQRHFIINIVGLQLTQLKTLLWSNYGVNNITQVGIFIKPDNSTGSFTRSERMLNVANLWIWIMMTVSLITRCHWAASKIFVMPQQLGRISTHHHCIPYLSVRSVSAEKVI